MNSRTLDLVYGTVLFAIAMALYWVSFDLQVAGRSIASDPAWFPRLLLGMMLIAAVVLGGRALARRSTARGVPLRGQALAITVGAAGLYLMSFYEIGFIPSTLVVIPVMSWLLGFRRPLVITLVTVALTITLWYAFTLLLNVTPPGFALPVPA